MDKRLRIRGRFLGALLRFTNKRSFERTNSFLRFYRRIPPKSINRQQSFIKNPHDGSSIRLLIYKQKNAQAKAAGLLWFHGGGYALGKPEMDEALFGRFLAAVNCVIVSPDYRLSVHKPYPCAFEDCYAALLWMRDHAEELGIRDDQLFVGGNSAGGGLAAAVALCARDKGEVNLAFQMPLYPMIDDRMNTPSATNNLSPVWNSRSNAAAWKLYLGQLFGTDRVPKYAAPARETDYSHLPPAFTLIGSIDPFYDETLAYVNNLRKAGIRADLAEFEGCFHAFDRLCPGSVAGKKANAELIDALRYAGEHHHASQPSSADD